MCTRTLPHVIRQRTSMVPGFEASRNKRTASAAGDMRKAYQWLQAGLLQMTWAIDDRTRSPFVCSTVLIAIGAAHACAARSPCFNRDACVTGSGAENRCSWWDAPPIFALPQDRNLTSLQSCGKWCSGSVGVAGHWWASSFVRFQQQQRADGACAWALQGGVGWQTEPLCI
jgi:hypothetical protein